MGDWDNLVEPTRDALEALLRKGDEMADRIEELEAKLAKAVEGLESIVDDCDSRWQVPHRYIRDAAQRTLAELKGQNQ